MQFKHPEILYALVLLIIPIIIHLFQLQKFKKVPFTNVQFLKNIQQQTRKSSRIKKLLVLASRMLAFTCLIFAFSQPYLGQHSNQQSYHTNLFLDNSFSMQAKGPNGELLKSATQEIIDNIGAKQGTFSLYTTNTEFNNLTVNSLKNELKNITYASNQLDLDAVLLKLKSKNSNSTNHSYKNILITDFQLNNPKNKSEFTIVNSDYSVVKLTPTNTNNIFIDSIYLNNESNTETTLNVVVKSTQSTTTSTPISLHNNTTLIGKSTVKFNDSDEETTQFTIPNSTDFNGIISINSDDLEFDNTFYFHLSKPDKINVLIIGEFSPFLRKIYTEDEFNVSQFTIEKTDYNLLQKQHLVILNSVENITPELNKSLLESSKNGCSVVVIPAQKLDISTYNSFLNSFGIGKIMEQSTLEKKITSINFNHPILKNVFEKQVSNFEYPTTKTSLKTTFNNSIPILSYASNEAFISSMKLNNSNFYWVAAALQTENSNFTNSSLIVPVFYNFAKQSLKTAQSYYPIQPETSVEIGVQIGKDNVLSIQNNEKEFIPLQEISQNKVSITLPNNDLQSGFYFIKNGKEIIKTIALNYSRNESLLNYATEEMITNSDNSVTIASTIDHLFDEIYQQQKINWLFKWFLAFSVLFLLIEMLLLKYFKI
ncbi:MAG: BatA domain-containing protein [Lutibacter sp.]|nr:BatA domain-containing protein [Lutibacter sp.]MBP9601356.1 BatA domain-containing protein [Lutibacter sp.]